MCSFTLLSFQDAAFLLEVKLTYSHKLYRSIGEVNLDDWQQVCQASSSNVFMDFRFLLTIEKTMAGFSKFWYVLFYDESGNPTACTVLSTFKADLSIVADQSTKQLISYVRHFFPSFLYLKVLFCGLPISIGQNYTLIAPGKNYQSVISLIDSVMNTIAASEKVGVIIYKEFDVDKCKQFDVLMRLGYRRADSLPMHCFPPKFSTFDDYCTALKFKYRKNIKISRQKFEKAGLRIINLRDKDTILQIYTPEVHQLYEAVVQKSDYKLEVLPVDFFCELERNLPNEIIFTLAYKANKIVGFVCSVCSNSSFYLLFCGLDYSLNPESDLYFNLIYESLNQALKCKVSYIEVGQTADTFKARLGCYQKPLYLYIKGRKFLLSWLIRTRLSLLFPPPPGVHTFDIYKQINTLEK